LNTEFKQPIIDIKLVGPGYTVTKEWEIVKVFRNGIREKISIPGRK